MEIVDFLKDPAKFKRLGATIPKGVLMVGPPGTGKTLRLKRLPVKQKFRFSVSQVLTLLKCLWVWVRPVSVICLSRRNVMHLVSFLLMRLMRSVVTVVQVPGGGHDEREQTLNEMLVEMDGFEGNEGIIVIAATNRADVLDKALLRPGRFDRQVMVGLPDIKGREQILNVHLKKLPSVTGVDVKVLARGTPGFSWCTTCKPCERSCVVCCSS